MPIKKPTTKAGKKKAVEGVMKEWKAGTLYSGSKKGPRITSQKQAIAVALSEAGSSNKGK